MNWWDFLSIRRGWQLNYGDKNSDCYVFFQEVKVQGPFERFDDAKHWAEANVEFAVRMYDKEFEEIMLT